MGKPMEKAGFCCLMLTLWPDGRLLCSALKRCLNGDEVINWGGGLEGILVLLFFLALTVGNRALIDSSVCFPLPPLSRFLAYSRTGHHPVQHFQEYLT